MTNSSSKPQETTTALLLAAAAAVATATTAWWWNSTNNKRQRRSRRRPKLQPQSPVPSDIAISQAIVREVGLLSMEEVGNEYVRSLLLL